MSSARTHELWGGAITAELPSSFESLTDLINAPDNQEVFRDPDSNTSVVIELLSAESASSAVQSNSNDPSRPDQADADTAAFRYIFDDAVGSTGDEVEVVQQPAPFRPASARSRAYTLLARVKPTPNPTAPSRTGAAQMSSATLAVGLIRLRPAAVSTSAGDTSAADTDVLFTVDVKRFVAEGVAREDGGVGVDGARELGAAERRAVQVRDRLLESFTVVDDGIFLGD